ncbi:MAG: trigger factor [Chloroflexi bacterium]|nr:trigger factor [Chloroflexota bacterium]
MLDIEVEPERLEKSLDAEYRRFASKARVPGFRPGKAPRAAIERAMGGPTQLRAGLMDDAIKRLVPDVYNEVIETQDVDAIAQPELEIVEVEPVRFKATVPVRPTVELNDYRSVRVPRDPVEVTDEMVAEQVMLLRRRHATIVPVERPVQWNDVLTANVAGTVTGDEVPFVDDKDAEFPLREGVEILLPGLAEAFLGMSKGDTKTVELTAPEDFRLDRAQGKPLTFAIEVKEVKEEQLPDEDDELANSVNADEFQTMEALRTRIREDLERSLTEQNKAKHHQEALDKILEGATLDYPKVVVDREIEHIINDQVGNDRQGYMTYLQRIGRSEAEYRETFRETAETRVRRSLVLNQVAELEKIEPTEEEVEAEVDKLIGPMGEDGERFRALFAGPEGRATIRRNLVTQKTFDRISAIAAGEAEAEAEEATA